MFRASKASAIGLVFAAICLSVATVVAALRADWFAVVLGVGVATSFGISLWRALWIVRGRDGSSNCNDRTHPPACNG